MEKVSSRLRASQRADQKPTAAVQVRTGLITMALAVLQTVLIAWFGFALTGRIELVLKERSMTLTAASALASLVNEMQDTGKDAPTQAAYVRKIAMYGREAVEPLTLMAVATGPYDEKVPLAGLRLVAVHHRGDACLALGTVIAAEPLVDRIRFASIKKLHAELKC